MDLTWMAWTWPTALFFVLIAASIALMGVLEFLHPGGAPRRGIFAIETTRGDRLFISLLGSAFMFLGWLGLVGGGLHWAAILAAAWTAVVFAFA